jgi:hypothetical protein
MLFTLLVAHLHFVTTMLQPHPDPALLTTPSLVGGEPFDETAKVNVVQRDTEPLTKSTSDAPTGTGPSPPRGERGDKHSEDQTPRRWDMVKDIVLRPSVAGGLVGVGMSAWVLSTYKD